MVKIKRLADATLIELSPNRSITWQQTRLIMLIFGGFCLSIAIVWSFIGAWLILPFAGIEIGLLSVLMYVVSKATYEKQIILINEKYLSVQEGSGRRKKKMLFSRSVLSLIGYETNHPDDVKEMFVVQGKQKHRIGPFLNQEDQTELLSVLKGLEIHYLEIRKPMHIDL